MRLTIKKACTAILLTTTFRNSFSSFVRFKWEESLTQPTPRNLSAVVVTTSGTLVRPPEAGILIIVLGKRGRKKLFSKVLLNEYWMIYRGPGFLAVVWFGSSTSPSPSPVNGCLSCSVLLWVACRAYWREKTRERVGERSQIIRRRGCLVIYKPFNTQYLCVQYIGLVVLYLNKSSLWVAGNC